MWKIKTFKTKEAYLKSLMDGTYQATLINAVNQAQKVAAEPKAEEKIGIEIYIVERYSCGCIHTHKST